MPKLLLAASIFGLLAGLTACGGNDSPESEKTLFFTAIPDNDESTLRARFEPMARYLEEELGVKVVYKPVTSYPLSVEAMKSKDVYLAWFGGLTGVQARELTSGQAIAMGEADAAFYSYLIAHPSSGLKAGDEFPQGMAGKTFTFGSQSSTSGRLMPEAYIRKHTGKGPGELFSKVGYSGSHNLTIDAVANGAYDLGAVNGKTFETRKAAGKTGEAYIIWKTPFYADYNWSVPGDIDEVYGAGFKDRLQQALLALDYEKPDHRKILDAYPRKKFIKAENTDFSAIKDTADALGITRPAK